MRRGDGTRFGGDQVSTVAMTNERSVLHGEATMPFRRHLVIVGFMGAGKSTIAQLLASRTGRGFVDLDQLISEAAGRSVRDLFQDIGEVAFRARERTALRELLSLKSPLVIATGATTFVDPIMCDWIKRAGTAIYLAAEPETLVRRMELTPLNRQRPFRAGPDLLETVRRWVERHGRIYEEAECVVRTDSYRLEEEVEEISRLLRLERPMAEKGRMARAAGGR